MIIDKIENFTKGWFIGNFEPSIMKTDLYEIAVKKYKSGDKEEKHHHKIATEITVVVSGIISMNEEKFIDGDIITVLPNESVEFKCINDSVTIVIKTPSIIGDKYT